MIKTLYKVSKTGKLQIWSAYTEGDNVIKVYGQKDGKQSVKTTKAKAKNIGKANATTPEEQALLEVTALYQKQHDNKHYRYTVEAAISAEESSKVPMKILNYKDHSKKVKFPCYVGVKYNGSRAMFINGSTISKAGIVEDFKVEDIKEDINELGLDVDTEIYSHGFSLQRIQSARNKPNTDTASLKAVIFDVPIKNLSITERVSLLKIVEKDIKNKGLKNLLVEIPVLVNSVEELETIFNNVTPEYEGVVIWNLSGTYEFGVRTSHVFKWKPRYDGEAKVLEVTEDKNGNGVLHCISSDSLDCVNFKCVMKVLRRDSLRYPKDYHTMTKLIGSWITFSYEELSDDGIPTKPVGECPRQCDSKGEPLE